MKSDERMKRAQASGLTAQGMGVAAAASMLAGPVSVPTPAVTLASVAARLDHRHEQLAEALGLAATIEGGLRGGYRGSPVDGAAVDAPTTGRLEGLARQADLLGEGLSELISILRSIDEVTG